MSSVENYEVLVIGTGEAGKYVAWTMAGEGHRTVAVERDYLGGACPNVACLPSKNIIHSAKVRWFTMRAAEFGVELESAATSMKGVQARKRAMVDGLHQLHLDRFRASGAEAIMGEARFIGDRTVDVELTDGGSRRIRGERVFLDLGTHATVPDVPGLAAARPMTHVGLLDLDRLPEHLIIIGGGYVGLELAQAMRRFGAGHRHRGRTAAGQPGRRRRRRGDPRALQRRGDNRSSPDAGPQCRRGIRPWRSAGRRRAGRRALHRGDRPADRGRPHAQHRRDRAGTGRGQADRRRLCLGG